MAGTGNASGTSLTRPGYSALGDSAGSNYSPADFDTDGEVDLADYAVFASHVNGPNQPGQGANWQRADLVPFPVEGFRAGPGWQSRPVEVLSVKE